MPSSTTTPTAAIATTKGSTRRQTQRAARPRAALNLPGACPVCGEAALRKLTFARGVGREAYRCVVDGNVEYLYGGEQGLSAPGFPEVPRWDVIGPATRMLAMPV